MSDQDKKCDVCKKPESELTNTLKNCAKCKTMLCCSRECQKADWKCHKEACAFSATQEGSNSEPSTSASASASTKTNAKSTSTSNSRLKTRPKTRPRFTVDRPFTAIQNNTWLSTSPEADVYQLSSDIFRLRREDSYVFNGDVDEDSIYGGASPDSELRNHRRFLTKITQLDAKRATNKKWLPTWWSPESFDKCIRVARTDKDAMFEYAVEQSDIMEFYGTNDMPMQLRMVGEKLDGTKTAGQSGAMMLTTMVGVEQNQGGIISSLMSVR